MPTYNCSNKLKSFLGKCNAQTRKGCMTIYPPIKPIFTLDQCFQISMSQVKQYREYTILFTEVTSAFGKNSP